MNKDSVCLEVSVVRGAEGLWEVPGVTLRSEPGRKGATGSRSKMWGWGGVEGSLGRKRLI